MARRKPEAPPKTGVAALLETLGIVVVAVVLAFGIQAFLVKPFRIPSESMVPTLQVGQRVLVNRLSARFGDPSVGDVVVFHPPATATSDAPGFGPSGMCGVRRPDNEACPESVDKLSDQNFIKRVVAGPGDTIAIVGGHVIRNGKRQREPFVQEHCPTGSPADFPRPLKVPAGHWFMMGDNRECSQDSRFWGPIPKRAVIGAAFATYWPPRRIGPL